MPSLDQVYLDYNATAPIRPGVVAAMAEAMQLPSNPSSVHGFGRAARRMIERCRQVVADAVGARPGEVMFTSGGTEANNIALGSVPGPVAISGIEHPSVLNVRHDATILPVAESGVLDLDEAQAIIERECPALVSLMLANNETGCLQPVSELAKITRACGALLHVDAVQGLGKLTVDRDAIDADYLSLSAHKIGGPQGIGALIVREDVPFRPALMGGAQENRRRAGTENVAGIAGFAEAIEAISASEIERVRALRELLEKAVLHCTPSARVIGSAVERLPNTVALALPGVRHETQLMRLDLDGIAVSTGSACSSGKVAVSHVLRAMDLPVELAESTIRISLGWQTSEDDIKRFLESWSKLAGLVSRAPITT